MSNQYYTFVVIAIFAISINSTAQDWKSHMEESTMSTIGETYSNIGSKIGKYTKMETDGYPNIQFQLGASRAYGEFARLKMMFGGKTGYVLQGGVGKDFFLNMRNSDVVAWHAGMAYYISEQGCFDTTFGINYAETPVVEGGSVNFDINWTYFFNRGRFCRCRRQYSHDRWPIGIFFGGSLGIGNLKGSDYGEKKGHFVWDVQVGISIALYRSHSKEYYECKEQSRDTNVYW